MSYTFAEANAGSGGPKFAVDLIAGWQYPISKISFGGAGVSTPVEASTPLPVADSALATVPDLLTTINDSLANVRRFGSAWGTDGRLRVQLDAAQALGTISAVTTVTTVSTVSNQSQTGGYQASNIVQATMNMAAQNNIRNMVG